MLPALSLYTVITPHQPAADGMGIEDDSDKGVSDTGDVQQSDDQSRVPSENDLGNARAPAVDQAEARAEEQAIAEAVEEAAVAIAEAERSEAEAAAASRDNESIISASSVSRLENGTHGDIAAIVHQTSGNSNSTGTTGMGALASESGVGVDQSGSVTLSSNVNGAAGAVAAVVANGFPVDTTATAAVTPMENGEIYPRD